MNLQRGKMRKLLTIIGVLGFAAGAAWLLVSSFWASEQPESVLALEPPAPLKPVTRSSTLLIPASITIPAIRDAADAAAPRSLNGRRDNLAPKVLSKGQLVWNVDRGPLAAAGKADGLTLSTPLTGALQITGQLGGAVGDLGNVLGGLIGNDKLAKSGDRLKGKGIDQKADLRGTAAVTAHPALNPGWRIEPNLTANVSLTDVVLPVGPLKIRTTPEVKPVIDKAVAEQIKALEARVRADPFIEQAARREWGRLCRSFALASAVKDAPRLWLEVKPLRVMASQPRIDTRLVHLSFGVEAATRVLAEETRPECPFPERLDIVPQPAQGHIAIGIPIDLPFPEVNRLLQAQLVGKTFGAEDQPVAVTVKRGTIAASGDRLLISLRVTASEKRFFGFGADATVHVWGKPKLDTASQVLRFTDLELAVDSDAMLGLLGTAAKAAAPYLLPMLAEQAVLDLKPLAADARKRIDTAIGEFVKRQDGVRLDIKVTGLRLTDIDFDAHTLRIVGEADATAAAALSTLAVPGQ